jgi:hypothetical protein
VRKDIVVLATVYEALRRDDTHAYADSKRGEPR